MASIYYSRLLQCYSEHILPAFAAKDVSNNANSILQELVLTFPPTVLVVNLPVNLIPKKMKI